MTNRSDHVDAFVDALEHSRKAEIQRLRLAILASDDAISESVKWNAPNFIVGGEDRVTFRLQPGNRVQLILHRGAKVRGDAADFAFADPDQLITWAAPDRGVITIEDAADLTANQRPIIALIGRWVRA